MPIYEYTCQDCSAHFEKFVRSMTSTEGVPCPECGGTRTKKGWSVFGTTGQGGGLGSLASAASAASSCSPAGT
jgi:putative FmdB family regulatory protein